VVDIGVECGIEACSAQWGQSSFRSRTDSAVQFPENELVGFSPLHYNAWCFDTILYLDDHGVLS
jgi:hypothetical protein